MKSSNKSQRIKGLVAIAVISIAAWLVWQELQPEGPSEGISSGNGRIEATEIDIATRVAGRLKEVLVEEGEFVEVGQVVARMDTATLEADLAQARAQTRRYPSRLPKPAGRPGFSQCTGALRPSRYPRFRIPGNRSRVRGGSHPGLDPAHRGRPGGQRAEN